MKFSLKITNINPRELSFTSCFYSYFLLKNSLTTSRHFNCLSCNQPNLMASAVRSKKTVQQPLWTSPYTNDNSTSFTIHSLFIFFTIGSPIMVNNSLVVDKLVPFALKKGSNIVNWYSCGPTVYDSAHLGHARHAFSLY